MRILDASQLRTLAQILDSLSDNEETTEVETTGQLTLGSGVSVELIRVLEDGAFNRYAIDIDG